MKRYLKIFSLILLPAALSASELQVLDPQFKDVVSEQAPLVTIASEMQFTEGPVWVWPKSDSVGYLLFSDIPADRIYRWRPGEDGKIELWRSPSGKANGLLLDSEGRLVACEHANRRVSLTVAPDSVITLCDRYRGARLNSPNDAALGADGSLWFTDPPYGLGKRKPEQPANFVFRLAPGEREPKAVVDDFDRPNGIVFSPDKKILYIADSGRPHHVRSFRVVGDSLSEIGVFAVVSPGAPDGMCVDEKGRLYVAAGDGIHVFNPEGTLLGKILTPKRPTNCCFGGEKMQGLFITARSEVYKIRLNVRGLP